MAKIFRAQIFKLAPPLLETLDPPLPTASLGVSAHGFFYKALKVGLAENLRTTKWKWLAMLEDSGRYQILFGDMEQIDG